MRTRWPVLLAVALLALAACGDDEEARSGEGDSDTGTAARISDLAGAAWQLKSYAAGSADDLRAATSTPATASVSGGRVSGTTGCNRYDATATLAGGGTLTVGSISQTAAACADASVSAQEQAFTKGLGRAKRAVLADGLLQLLDADGDAILLFDR